MDVKSSKPVSVTEAKEILSKRTEDGELGYEQTQAHDNLEKFATLKAEKVHDLVTKLTKSGKINQDLAIKIVDISPTNPSTLKAILSKDRVDLPEEEINELIKEIS